MAQELASLSTRKKVYDEQVIQLRTERQKVEAEQEKLQADQLNFSNLKSDLTRKIELFDVQKDSSEKSAAEREERLENLKSRLEITQQNLAEVQNKSELLLTEKNDLDKLLTELSADLATLSESPEVVMERLRDEFVQLVEEEARISNEIVRNKAEITDLSRRQSEQDESVRENLTKFEKISQDLSEAQENLNTVKKRNRDPFSEI